MNIYSRCLGILLVPLFFIASCGGGSSGSGNAETPIVDDNSVADPVTDPVTDPVADLVTDPVTDPVADVEVIVPGQGSILTGTFVDGPVAGIDYSTASQSGTTNALGEFLYMDSEVVSFSIGSLSLPSSKALPRLSPMELAIGQPYNVATWINIARVLQSIDLDGDPENGIEIPTSAGASSTAIDFSVSVSEFESDVNVINFIANSGSSTVSLVSIDAALTHLYSTLGIPQLVGDVEAGRAIAESICNVCHSNDNISGVNLVGLPKSFIVAMLEGYQKLETQGPETAVMRPLASALTDQDIADIAAFYSGYTNPNSDQSLPTGMSGDPDIGFEHPAQSLMTNTTQTLLQLLQESEAGVDVDTVIEVELDNTIDFTTMTTLAVGPEWRDADVAQMEMLVGGFRRILIDDYVSFLREHSNTDLTFSPFVLEARFDRATVVARFNSVDTQETTLVFKLAEKAEGDWQIFDIEIDGTSWALNYRNIFSTIIESEGIEGLIMQLPNLGQ